MANSFWQGWDAQEAQTRGRNADSMNRATAQMGLLQKIQAQQDQRVVNEILSKGQSLEQVAPELQKTEAGRKVLTQLYEAQKQQMEMERTRRSEEHTSELQS